jgi:probable HAF family extracellular repeat protein
MTSYSAALLINDKGQVLIEGDNSLSTTEWLPVWYLYQDGSMTQLDPPQQIRAADMNNSGQAAGGAMVDEAWWPCLYDIETNTVNVLGSLGGQRDGRVGAAAGINNLGQVVGSSYVDYDTYHGFLYTEASGMVDLGLDASSINDAGLIVVGWGPTGRVAVLDGAVTTLLTEEDGSRRHPGHKVYPYLLRDLPIVRPNQVWAADITYIPMNRGFMLLTVVMDGHSREVLSWRCQGHTFPGMAPWPFRSFAALLRFDSISPQVLSRLLGISPYKNELFPY